MQINLIIRILSIAIIAASTYMVAVDDEGKWEKSGWQKWNKPKKWSNWKQKIDRLEQMEQVDTVSNGNTYELNIKEGANLRGVAIAQGNANYISVTTNGNPEQKSMKKREAQVTSNLSPKFRTEVIQGEHLDVFTDIKLEQSLITAVVQGNANQVLVSKEVSDNF